MPYESLNAVGVWCWNQQVGAISLDARTGFYAFQYYDSWVERGIELAPFFMPTNAGSQNIFEFPNLRPDTFHRLPAMIADSMPDAFGNSLIRAFFISQGVSDSEITYLDRLGYLSNRSMGALEFRPATYKNDRKQTAIEISELVSEARRAVNGTIDSDTNSANALSQLIRVGTSAGGARAKAVIAWNPETNELLSGQLPAPSGFEHWILKFDGLNKDKALGTTQNYGRIEFAYSLMARAAGIDMPATQLLEENGRAHFMIKRFDRAGNDKIHMQTLCAIAHLDFQLVGTHSYAEYFDAAERLGLDAEAREQIFRRMVFNVIAANRDDHTKNASFLCGPDGQWSLAPGYDITHAYRPSSEWVGRHQMSVNGKFDEISKQDLLITGDRFEVPAFRAIYSEVTDAVASWPEWARKAGVPAVSITEVADDIAATRPS